MKKLTLLIILIFIFTFCGNIYASSEYTYKLGHPGDTNSSFHKTAELLNEKLSDLSNGALKISIYPQGQLGKDAEVFEQMQKGSVDMEILAPGHIGGRAARSRRT